MCVGLVVRTHTLEFDADLDVSRIFQDYVALFVLNEYQFVSLFDSQDLWKVSNEGYPILVADNGFP